MKTSITFKGETLTRTKVKNNILKIYNLTTEEERFDWYQDANDYAEELSWLGVFTNTEKEDGSAHRKACGVIAALSPLKTWQQNKKIAYDLIETGEAGHIKQFVDKANKIIDCDGSDEAILAILNGRKITSFYLNIMYPHKAEFVTIDRHALSIALGCWTSEKDYAGMTANQYNFFVQCFTLAAMKADISPVLMQSSTWVRWRKIKKEFKRR